MQAKFLLLCNSRGLELLHHSVNYIGDFRSLCIKFNKFPIWRNKVKHDGVVHEVLLLGIDINIVRLAEVHPIGFCCRPNLFCCSC